MRKTLLTTIAVAGLAVSLSALAAACKQEVAASQRATASEPMKVSEGKSKIAKVVFVGKKDACDCTRKRIDHSWAALQQALGAPAKLPVVCLQIDVDGEKVEIYKQQKAIMALPAIYFIDGKAKVLELLQGEVTAEQVKETIGA